MSDDLPDVAKYAVVLVVMVAVGVPIFTSLAGDVSELRTTSSVELINEGTATLDGSEHEGVSIQQSLGLEAELTGENDSYIVSPSADMSGDYTLSTIVAVDGKSGPQIVYADQTRSLIYNGTSGNWTAVHYNSTTDSTWYVTMNATSSRATVQTVVENGKLTLYEDNGLNASVALDEANETTREFSGDNLDGSLDETRVVDEPLNASQRQFLVDRPTAPLDANTALRIMYDSFDRNPLSLPAFYVGGDAITSQVSLVDGAQGEPTERGIDYERSGGEVTTLEGGSLDGAPALYATWTATFGEAGVLGTIIRLTPLFLGLFIIGYVVRRIRVMTR